MVIYEKGNIHRKGEVQSGVSQRGNAWSRQDLILAVENGFNTFRYLSLRCENEQVEDIAKLNVGDAVEVGYVVSSREWQGRWYTDAKLVNIKVTARQASRPAPQQESLDYNPNDLPNF